LRALVLAAFFAAAERLDEVRFAVFFAARPAGDFFFALAFRAGAFFALAFFALVFVAVDFLVLFFADVPFAPPSCRFTVAQARFCAVFFDTPRFS
jgi:hypothetical protein